MGRASGVLLAACWICAAGLGLGAEAKTGRVVLLGTNVVSLGTYPNTEDRTSRVQIRNAGDGPLRIERVVTTCACMRVDAYPSALGPGETGEVVVSITKNEVSGAFQRVYYIETSDPVAGSITVKLEGYATSLFIVTCDKETELGPVGTGLVWTGKFAVAATEPGVFLGSPVARNSGTRSAYTLTTNRTGLLVYEVEQVVAFEGVGILQCDLVFPVVGEKWPGAMPVKLAVSAVRHASFRIAPDRLQVSASSTPVKRRLVLSVNDAQPLDVAQLSWRTALEGIEVQPRLSKSGKGFMVDVTFPVACVDQLRNAGRSEMYFRYRNGPEVALPVQAE